MQKIKLVPFDIGIGINLKIDFNFQVTGGSNGIGREICLELARSGCNVACLDVDLQAAKKLCDELKLLGVEANAYNVSKNNVN